MNGDNHGPEVDSSGRAGTPYVSENIEDHFQDCSYVSWHKNLHCTLLTHDEMEETLIADIKAKGKKRKVKLSDEEIMKKVTEAMSTGGIISQYLMESRKVFLSFRNTALARCKCGRIDGNEVHETDESSGFASPASTIVHQSPPSSNLATSGSTADESSPDAVIEVLGKYRDQQKRANARRRLNF